MKPTGTYGNGSFSFSAEPMKEFEEHWRTFLEDIRGQLRPFTIIALASAPASTAVSASQSESISVSATATCRIVPYNRKHVDGSLFVGHQGSVEIGRKAIQGLMLDHSEYNVIGPKRWTGSTPLVLVLRLIVKGQTSCILITREIIDSAGLRKYSYLIN
jgi:hypothetical protein